MKGQSDADEIKEGELRVSGKRDKTDPGVNYFGPERGPFECGRCEYFIKPGACQKVKGHIEFKGCCNLFENK